MIRPPLLVIGELNGFFCCYIFVTRDGRGGTLLSLVDPGSNNISIVPELPFQEVGRLLLSAQQRAGRLSCNGPGDSDGSPSCTSLPKGVTASYQLTNIYGLTMRRASCLNILLFIQSIFICFMTFFIWYHFCSIYYYYFYYVYIVILSYSRLFFSFNILFGSSDYFFSHVLLYAICLFFVQFWSVFWITNIYANYIMIHLQYFVTMFWFIHWISFFDHHNLFVLVFWFIYWILLFDHNNIKRWSFIFLIHFYMVIQW